jgi:hypothetical protein
MGAASMIGNASTERSQHLTGKSFDMVENFLLREKKKQTNVAVRQRITNDSRNMVLAVK